MPCPLLSPTMEGRHGVFGDTGPSGTCLGPNALPLGASGLPMAQRVPTSLQTHGHVSLCPTLGTVPVLSPWCPRSHLHPALTAVGSTAAQPSLVTATRPAGDGACTRTLTCTATCCQPQGTRVPNPTPNLLRPQGTWHSPTKRGRPSPCDGDAVVTSAPAPGWHLQTHRGDGTGWDEAAVAPPRRGAALPPPPSSNPTEPPRPPARPDRSPFSQRPTRRPAPSSPLTGTATS